MSEFKNVVQWTKNEKTGKSRTIKLGYAKEDNKGKLRITLDALPIPRKNNFGEYTIELCLEEPYNHNGGSGGGARTSVGGFGGADYGHRSSGDCRTGTEDTDDIPF